MELRELLKELSRMGKTIIISSHILTELTEMCTHIGIIERGNLLASGRVSDIMRRLNLHSRIIRVKMRPLPPEYQERLQAVLAQAPNVKAARPLDVPDNWELQVEGDEQTLNNVLRYLVHHNVPLYSFSEQATNLEEIFMQVTKGYVA
jgi:ABC-2 type transport system ATP-binding protein